jgi:hypothetical protein
VSTASCCLHLRLVQEGSVSLGADLYSKHLEDLKREPAFGEAVLSFPDKAGGHREIALDDVEATEDADDGSNRTEILLRNGAIVLASGAVIVGAIAADTDRSSRERRPVSRAWDAMRAVLWTPDPGPRNHGPMSLGIE